MRKITDRAAVVRLRVTIMLALIGLAIPPLSAAQQPGEDAVAEAVAELHLLVNLRRVAARCEPLRWHEPTAQVAEAHSRDMARRSYFDHLTPEGTDLSERLLAGGVTWHGSIAENIALTVRGPETVIDLWMDSPAHRSNIEDCSFTHEGLGLYVDRWTQVLVERPGS